MIKQKASTKTSSIKKKTFKTRTIATSQCFQASFTSFNHEDDVSILIENNVTVNKNSLLSSQYTVFYTVKLNEKTVKKDSKVYQIDREIKSFV